MQQQVRRRHGDLVEGRPVQSRSAPPYKHACAIGWIAGEESVQVFGGSFYSPIRDRAIALNCMLETDPENQQIGILAQQLSEMMKMRPYLNTQERSFAFLAFGKLAR